MKNIADKTEGHMPAKSIGAKIVLGVTDYGKIGDHVAITDRTRMLEDGRHVGYAIGYTAPIGPVAPKP